MGNRYARCWTLGSVSTSTSAAGKSPNAGGFANALGHKEASRSGSTIIAQVAQNVFSNNLHGMPYPSGILWVRFVDSFTSGETTSDQDWFAVPDTLPSGYTANNKRNCVPKALYTQGTLRTSATLPIFVQGQPSYTPTYPIRTGSGIYLPMDNSNTYIWGPYAPSNKTFGDGQGASNFIGYTMASKYTGTHGSLGLHPGCRTVSLLAQWTEAFYAATTMTSGEYRLYRNAGATLVATITVNKSDLVHNVPNGTWDYQYGPVTCSSQPAMGDLEEYIFYEWDSTPSHGLGGSGSQYSLFCAPRVDIPLPFTCTYGNLVAPGGILTGSIPGF